MEGHINDEETIRSAQNGDEEAMERIVSTNLGLVKSIATRFIGRGCEFEDLMQIGTIGMIKAVKGFQTDKNCRFSTYAVPLIIGEIKRHLRDDGWIKISRDTKQNATRIFRFSEEYEKTNGFAPSLETIREKTGLSEEEIAMALSSSRPALSLYEKDEESGFSPENLVGVDPTEEMIGKIALTEVLSQLPEIERKLITLRFFKHLTQEQTARLLSLTQVKVSREEKKILRKLRLLLEESA